MLRIKLFSTLPQISESRPFATMENSSADFAFTFRWRSNARAAASNPGPRFAEVAGRLTENDVERRVGLAHCLVLLLRLLERLEHGIRAGIEHNRRALAGSQNAGFVFERRSCK